MGIVAYHPMTQVGPQESDCLGLKIDNPCVEVDCQGMCILSKDVGGLGVGYRCVCPIGQVLIALLLNFNWFSCGMIKSTYQVN